MVRSAWHLPAAGHVQGVWPPLCVLHSLQLERHRHLVHADGANLAISQLLFVWARGKLVAVEIQPEVLLLASPAAEDAPLGGAHPVLVVQLQISAAELSLNHPAQMCVGQALRTLMPVANFLDATSMSSRRST